MEQRQKTSPVDIIVGILAAIYWGGAVLGILGVIVLGIWTAWFSS